MKRRPSFDSTGSEYSTNTSAMRDPPYASACKTSTVPKRDGWSGACLPPGTCDHGPMAKPLDPRTEIGHVHLKVSDLDRAVAFYTGALGFEVTQRMGDSAAFLSAGGYHHHIGLNTWESSSRRGACAWHDRSLSLRDPISRSRVARRGASPSARRGVPTRRCERSWRQ